MGQFHVQHGGERSAEHGDELAGVCAVVRIHQMYCSQLGSKGTKVKTLLGDSQKDNPLRSNQPHRLLCGESYPMDIEHPHMDMQMDTQPIQ